MYQIIPKSKIWLTLSSILAGLSIVGLIIWGINFGIDFTGGSLLEIKFLAERPTVSQVQNELSDLSLGSLIIQPAGEDGMILRFQDTSEEKHQEVLERLNKIVNPEDTATTDMSISETQNQPAGLKIEGENIEGLDIKPVDLEGENIENLQIETVKDETLPTEQDSGIMALEELRFDSIGPSIGQELKRKSIYAILFVLVAIILYIAWVFRKVSKPVASWKYGLSAIVALFHDVIIVLGVFVVLGKFFSMEINTPFVAALLTVLGYSVNDTIVVFDRIRENLPRSEEDFAGTVNISVNQTIRRSINTSLTTLVVLLSILFFGGSTIRDFVLALCIGIFVGTYSSIFLASPILVLWERFKK